MFCSCLLREYLFGEDLMENRCWRQKFGNQWGGKKGQNRAGCKQQFQGILMALLGWEGGIVFSWFPEVLNLLGLGWGWARASFPRINVGFFLPNSSKNENVLSKGSTAVFCLHILVFPFSLGNKWNFLSQFLFFFLLSPLVSPPVPAKEICGRKAGKRQKGEYFKNPLLG